MSGGPLHSQEKSRDPELTINNKSLIETGQTKTGIPKLEGEKLMKTVNAVIRHSALIDDPYAEAEAMADLEHIYRIGLENPDKIDDDNIRKLFENPLAMAWAKVALTEEIRPETDRHGREFRRKYAEYVVERFGKDKPEADRAIKVGYSYLTSEFKEKHNITDEPS